MSKGVFVTDEQVRLTGSPNVARFLAQCLYWSENKVSVKRQGWFYKSRTEWQAETWLSRYQQEKARKQLRDMGLLQERKERTNIGIRIWFWVDQALLNVLLNNLAEQAINKDAEPVNNTNGLYDSSLINKSDNCISGQLDNCKDVEESKSVEVINTIVPKTPLLNSNNGVNSTMVLNNNDKDLLNNSDNHCINNDEAEDIDSGMDKELAVAPSLSKYECNKDIYYCEEPEAYKACHPFIYQFLTTRLLTGHDWSADALSLFRCEGLMNPVLQDALFAFINQHGHSLMAWYQEHTPIPVNPLTRADLELAVLISEGDLS